MLKIKKNNILRIITFLFLLILVSRGFFELLIEKKAAFISQVLAVALFLLLTILIFEIRLERKLYFRQLNFFALFFIFAFSSAVLTTLLNNGGAPFFYCGIIFFLLLGFIHTGSLKITKYGPIDFGTMSTVLIVILFSVAIYEQINNYLMPGAWWYHGTIRPASLTGSKQHYSIIMAILALFNYQYWISLKKGKYLLGFALGVLAVILSLTRSGAMILVVAFLFYYGFIFYRIHRLRINKNLLFFLLFSSIFALIAGLWYFDFSFFLDRILSSVDTGSSGNSERVVAWKFGWDLLSHSNWLLGEYTGVATNATRTVTSTDSFVVESGTLQTILNFGVLGFLCFYGIFVMAFDRIRKHLFLICILLSCLLSTNVYQSIETIPFVILLSILPLISEDIKSYEFSSNL